MESDSRPVMLLPESIPHGGIDHEELANRGLSADDVLDFSTNVNPFGPSPRVAEAIREVALDRYPDRESVELRRVLAERLGTSADRLLIGNGSSELLWLIGLAFLQSGDPVLIPQPTYGEYERVARLRDARLVECTAEKETGFQFPEEAVARRLERESPRICFLCRPNNPTGGLVSVSRVEDWAARFPGTLFVVDEAYIDFLPHVPSVLSRQLSNVLVTRSLGKAHALAGVRIGCVEGDPDALAALQRIRPPWSVSSVAQAAATAALRDGPHLTRSLEKLFEAKRQLIADVTASGFAVLSSEAPFILIEVGAAAQARSALLERGILVRDCTSFGLPEFIRVSPRSPQENAAFVEALRQLNRVAAGSRTSPVHASTRGEL